MRRPLELAAFAAAALVAAMAVHAWLASRADQLRLHATLSAQRQLVDAAARRESVRDAALRQSLARIDALERARQTPRQIVRALPGLLALPRPIALVPAQPAPANAAASGAAAEQGTGAPENSSANSASAEPRAPGGANASAGKAALPAAASVAAASGGAVAQIPAADLKPLYNFAEGCRACQLRLAAAARDRADDAAKLAAVTRERDAAVTAAKGGRFWQRLRRNAEWFAIGAAAGFAAAKR